MREVYVKLLRFEIELDVTQVVIPLALVAVPRWDSIPCVLVFSHVRCAGCAGAATSCCTLLDAAVAKRLLRALGLRAQCPRSAAAHRRDSQSAADSDFWVLNSATEEAVRSSVTPLDCAEPADSAGCSELSDSG